MTPQMPVRQRGQRKGSFMVSLRAWLVSGTFVAGVGAGMLCGAGTAAADTGDAGAARSSAHESTASARPDRGASRAVRTARTARNATAQPEKTPATSATGKPVKVPTVGVDPAASAKPGAFAAPPAAAKSPAVVPSSVPVDPAKYAGTYYEQGSVKQFFSVGLVNTKATYTANPDGTIKVQNSGNYFFNRGPRSSIVGSAVPVNATNTALNVGFFSSRPPSATPPGNYTILETAPDYSWAIVSDPSGRSGYILTRSKTISPEEYQQLTDRARALGVTGRITPTRQFPV